MKDQDFHYYSSLDEIVSDFYDWERHFINLACSVKDIFQKENSNDTSSEYNKYKAKLIHEYIHFLQYFATAWGAPIFTDLALATLKIGTSSHKSQEKIDLPLEIDSIKNSLLIEGLNERANVINRIEEGDSIQYNYSNKLENISVYFKENIVGLTNNRVIINLGMKVIREHMAHMGTQLFFNRTDSDIHKYHIKIEGFKKDGIGFSDQAEYWIIFEYFYAKKNFINISKGIFNLMQLCLIATSPHKLLLNFFKWFISEESKFKNNYDFVDVTENWLLTNSVAENLYEGFIKSKKQCEKILNLTEKYSKDNEFYLFVNRITDYTLKNIERNSGGRTLFNIKDQFNSFSYWEKKITEYGTGIIRYNDATQLQGSNEHCKNMLDSFKFLLSSSIVLKQILNNQITMCPFLYDIPICISELKDISNCENNPFLVKQNDGSEKECLFRNGIIILGMEKRLSLYD